MESDLHLYVGDLAPHRCTQNDAEYVVLCNLQFTNERRGQRARACDTVINDLTYGVDIESSYDAVRRSGVTVSQRA